MAAGMRIHTEDAADLASLRAMLRGLDQVEAAPHALAPAPGRLGAEPEYLAVLFGSGSAVTVALAVLKAWLQSKVTIIRVEVGDAAFSVTGRNAETLLPQVREAVLALRAASPGPSAVAADGTPPAVPAGDGDDRP